MQNKMLIHINKKSSVKRFFINNKKDISIFIGMLAFVFIICFNFMKPHYTNDCYYVNAYGYTYYAKHFLASNRIFSALILWIFLKLDIPLWKELSIMGVFLTITMAIAWFVLYKFIIKFINKEKSIFFNILIVLISFFIVFNICTAEGLLFVEVGTMPLGILFAILGSIIIVTDRKYKYIISLVLITLSGLCYQATSSIFVVLSLVLICSKNKGDIKKTIKQAIIIFFIYGIAMIINFIGVKIWDKILNNEFRKFEMPTLAIILKTIFKYAKYILIYNVGIGTKYSYLITIAIISIIFVIKEINKKEYFIMLEYIIIIILSILIPIIPIIITPVDLQYIEPRMAMCFGSIIGIILLFLLTVPKIEENKILLTIVLIISTIVFTGNSIFMISASTANLKTNKLDEMIAKEIIKEINNYESETGNEIKNIGVAFDKNYTMYYEGEPSLRCFNVRSMGTSWAIKEVLTKYTLKGYNKVDVPEDIKKQFLEKDWNEYDKQQLVFENENLYICIY